jgi:hypothetical protein
MRASYIRLIAIGAAVIGVSQLYGCSSKSTWQKAAQTDTYQSYQNYIETNPKGEHLAEAKKRADSRYWKSIKDDTTGKTFQQYLKKFPHGQYRAQAKTKMNQHEGLAAKARVTGSGVIIRSNHTTSSASKGVVAKKGTVVQLLDRYKPGSSNGAILKRKVTVEAHGARINLSKGKAIHVLAEQDDSVHASFVTSQFGGTEAWISKDAIEAMSGHTWYKIRTTDDITGWIYGEYIDPL